MSYRILANKEQGVKDFIVDTEDELDLLPTSAMGSTAFVIEGSKAFILNGKGEWKEI